MIDAMAFSDGAEVTSTHALKDLQPCNFPIAKQHASSPISAESVVAPIRFSTILDEFHAMNDVPRSSLAQDAFVCAFETIIINPERPFYDVDLFSQFDLWQVSQWNSRIHKPVDSCAHTKFEEVSATNPDAEAIRSWDGSLT